jgi:hypothetical protein
LAQLRCGAAASTQLGAYLIDATHLAPFQSIGEMAQTRLPQTASRYKNGGPLQRILKLAGIIHFAEILKRW